MSLLAVAPATSTAVALTSIEITGASTTIASVSVPFYDTMNGTRMLPSHSSPLPRRNGALLEADEPMVRNAADFRLNRPQVQV